MTKTGILLLLCAAACVACRAPEEPGVAVGVSNSPSPEIPADVQAIAETALGSGAAVLTFGDLAQNGHVQVLAANLLGQERPMGPSEAKVTRAVVIEKENATWQDVLRCDEYLKNPKGFLEGTPRDPVTGWLLKIDRKKGSTAEVRDFFFTPLQSGQPMPDRTIAVRWNHDADRYQSHKGNGQFLGEIATLEIPGSELR